MEKGLQVCTGQTHVHRSLPKLRAMIAHSKLGTTFLISHRLPLEEAPTGYKNFNEKQDSRTKVVLKPGRGLAGAWRSAAFTGIPLGCPAPFGSPPVRSRRARGSARRTVRRCRRGNGATGNEHE
jgi:hypothetical protein